MLLQTVLAAFIGFAGASLPAKLAQRNSDVHLEQRQAYPYPALTFDQIVRFFSNFLILISLFWLWLEGLIEGRLITFPKVQDTNRILRERSSRGISSMIPTTKPGDRCFCI
jgi:hypothetical protein